MNIQLTLFMQSQHSIGIGKHSIEEIYKHLKSIGYPTIFIADTSMDIFLECQSYNDIVCGYKTKILHGDKHSEAVIIPNNEDGYRTLLKMCKDFDIRNDFPYGIQQDIIIPFLNELTILLLDDNIISKDIISNTKKQFKLLNESEKQLMTYFLNKPKYEQQIQTNSFSFMSDDEFTKLKVFISNSSNLKKLKQSILLEEEQQDICLLNYSNVYRLNEGNYNLNSEKYLYSSKFKSLEEIPHYNQNDLREILRNVSPIKIQKEIQSYIIPTNNISITFQNTIEELINIYEKEEISFFLKKSLNNKQLLYFFSKINYDKISYQEIDEKKLQKLLNKKGILLNKITEEQKKEIAKKYNLYITSKEFLYNKEYRDRLAFELKEIMENGVTDFLSYFLTIENIIKLARENGLKIGDGRGSAVASLICFLLDITNIDPIKNKLNFKRFLQRSRFGNLNMFHKDLIFNEQSWEKQPLLDINYLKEKYVNLDINEEWIKSEYEFIDANPKIINYLLYLKEKHKFFEDNDSSIVYALGIGDKPKHKCTIKNLHPPDIDIDVNNRTKLLQIIEENYGIEQICQISVYNYFKMNELVSSILKKNSNIHNNQIEQILTELKKEKNKDELESFKKLTITNSTIRRFFSVYENEKNEIISNYNKLKSLSVHPSGIIICDKPVYENFPVYKRSNGMFIAFNDKNILEQFGFLKLDFLNLETLNELKQAEETSKFNMSEITYDDKYIFESFMKGDTDHIFQCKSNLVKTILKQTKQINSILDLAILMSAARPGPIKNGVDKQIIELMNNVSKKPHKDKNIERILSDSYGMIIFQEQIIEISEYIGMSNKDSLDIMYSIKNKNLDQIKGYKEKFIKKGLLSTKNDEAYLTELWNDMEQFGSYGFNKAHAVAYATIAYQCMFYQVYYKYDWVTSILNTDKNDINEIYLAYNFIKKPSRNSDYNQFINYKNEYILTPLRLCKKINEDHIKWIKEFYGKNVDDLKKYLKETLIKFKDYEIIVLSGLLDFILDRAKDRYLLLSIFKAHAEYTKKFESLSEKDFLELETVYINLPVKNSLNLEEINKISLNYLLRKIDVKVFENDHITYFGIITQIKKLKIKKDGENKGKDLIIGQISIDSQPYDFTIFPDSINQEIKEKDTIIFTGYKNKEGKVIISKYTL